MSLLNPAKNVFLFKPKNFSCNSFLIKGEKTALIDSASFAAEKEFLEMLSEIKVKPEEIDFILHTHGHYDHFEADELFPNAEIFMSEPDSSELKKKNFDFTHLTHPESFHPEIHSLLKENQIIEVSPFSLKTIFTPGHSKGSVCFYEPNQKWLFSGDTLFYHTIGRTDLETSSFDEIKKSIKKLSCLNIKFLFPGHGKTISGIKKNKENFEFIKQSFFNV